MTVSPLLAALLPGFTLSAHRAFQIAGRAWLVWMVAWLGMAFQNKSSKRRESPLQRIEHMVPAFLGFLLIFRADFEKTWLGRTVFPDWAALMAAGVAVTILGLLFSFWARLELGRNWSGTVTIKSGHQLIRRGPYRLIRHPIYTGMLAALLGTVATERLVSGLLGFALVLAALYRKARREESFLSQEFGQAFAEHRRHTGMFLPRFSKS
jgi:protein-S-isoprenylcysteine O-methyltransferase Ste14